MVARMMSKMSKVSPVSELIVQAGLNANTDPTVGDLQTASLFVCLKTRCLLDPYPGPGGSFERPLILTPPPFAKRQGYN